jgi:hypothetical protein
MPCKSADSILIKSLHVWVSCGAIDSGPLMRILAFPLEPKNVKQYPTSATFVQRLRKAKPHSSLTNVVIPFTRPNSNLKWNATRHSPTLKVCQVQHFIAMLYNDNRQTGLLVGLLKCCINYRDYFMFSKLERIWKEVNIPISIYYRSIRREGNGKISINLSC